MFKTFLLFLTAVIILIGLNYHIQNPVVVVGGAITVIVVHLALVGGAAHIIPTLKKRFHGEQ